MEALNSYTRYYQYRRRFEPTSTNSAAAWCHHLDFGPPAQLASPITDAWGAKAENCLLGGNRALALTRALPAHRGNAIITGADVRTDQLEVRIRVVREHDPQRIEQNVNTFFQERADRHRGAVWASAGSRQAWRTARDRPCYRYGCIVVRAPESAAADPQR